MRFESVHVDRYGCLADLSTGNAPLPSIVVVMGPNESGKSTFFDFLSTLLYGFRPATRIRHPYTPWAGGDPEGRAAIRLDDGTIQELHRRLLSSGRGTLTAGGQAENIGNRPLAAAGHVARVVFRQVYALTLAELAGLERESWDLVQDRLVGAMAAPDLRPAREVAAGFEREAVRLWRPDRRGRPRARILQAELRELNERRREVLERDRTLREKVAGKAAEEEELRALREERARERERRGVLERRLNRLLPVRNTLVRIEELRTRGGEAEELGGLPTDPEERLEELQRAADSAAEQAEVLSGGAAGEGGAPEEIHERLSELRERLFSAPWEQVDREQLLAIPVGDLREMVGVYEVKREQRRIAEEGLREEALDGLRRAAPSGRWRLWSGLAGVVAGGAAAVVGWWFPDLLRPAPAVEVSPEIVFLAGLGLAVLGLFTLIMWLDTVRHARRYRRAFAAAEKGRRTELRGLEESEEVARRAVVQSLRGLPVQPSLLEAPGYDLVTAIERMVELLADLRNRGRIKGRELDATLAAGRLAAFEERLLGLGDGDAGRGAKVARRRLDALHRANQLRAELERGHPALAEIEGRIREAEEDGEDWDSLPGRLEEADARIDGMTGRAEELQGSIGSLDSEIRHLREGATVDRIEGRIEAVKQRIRDVRERRDRAFVLARLVRVADRRFRDEHQPDLLLRAGGHLRHLTRGRYDGIRLGEPGDASFYLRGPAAPEPRKVGKPLSQGTMEQVYLALRLAIIDHLDSGGERLPLFMDEALVNWDASRRDRAFELLERVAEHRQVFLFTCHPAMAADLEDRGGRVIALGVG